MKKLIIPAVAFFLMISCDQTTTVSTGNEEKGIEIKEYTGVATVSPSISKQANDIPRRAYFGDTHLHTKYSPDANLQGNVNLGPADAFRFAKGKKVTAHNGMTAQLNRPLDFLVVTDHAEYLGLLPGIAEGNEILMASEYGQELDRKLKGTQAERSEAFINVLKDLGSATPQFESEEFTRSVWEYFTAVADNYNDPGNFTAFIGYEWTSMPKGNNLHRIVMFKDDAEYANQVIPFSAFDSENPEDLWDYLAGYEKKTGGNVLAIPHNGNTSNGLMFMDVDFDGKPLTKKYAEARMKWEPLVEITQIKGDGETHPLLSPNDEFADFETWDWGNLNITIPKKDEMLKYEYTRSALKLGLQLETELGVNPYKFGLQGASDAHTSLSGMGEENYWGKFTLDEPNKHKQTHLHGKEGEQGVFQNTAGDVMGAAGYTGVWATENTRAAIFDAIERKEVFATTGPRITVRLFGGWDYSKEDLYSSKMVDIGYEKGVPMGGDLSAKNGEAPSFMVVATKDIDGANLDRVQIVKGWEDANGEVHEKVYNVVLSDDRALGDNPKPVGNTVDIENATYSNSIGDVELSALWVDPNFDAKQDAFYYVRVLEIPTPRWTVYNAKFFDVELVNEGFPLIIQERAYTSPIWYTPKSK